MNFGRMVVIAVNVFREVIRDRILYLIVLFAIALVIAATLLPQLAAGTTAKILLDLGLAAINLLGLVVAEHLWRMEPDAGAGILTPRRAEIVSGANLARWADGLGLGGLLSLGRGEDVTGGRGKESLLATALEAVLAVVYLDGGLPAARGAIARLARW